MGNVRGAAFWMPLWGVLLAVAGCATVDRAPAPVEGPVSQNVQREQQRSVAPTPTSAKFLKRKVAIGRFTNETRYGKALLGGDVDPLGRQTGDMLAARLVESGKFVVLERPDLGLIAQEQSIAGRHQIPGADALIIGSLTEFGRNVTGKTGFLSGTKKQTAYAKVEVRLVDVKTGHAFHSASGVGEASMEEGEVAGFGSRASYDATLNDKAIGAAVSDLMSDIVSKLEERPWRTDVLKIDNGRLFLTGGSSQGLSVGDTLEIHKKGETVVSEQTGFAIELPGTRIATVRIVEFFGSDPTTEGSMAVVTSGSVAGYDRLSLYAVEP